MSIDLPQLIHKNLVAQIIGGSVAFGWNDHLSDVEIGLFWDKIPAQRTRKTILKKYFPQSAPIVMKDQNQEFGFSDHLMGNGKKIDIVHMEWNNANKIIRGLLNAERIGSDALILAANIRNGMILSSRSEYRNIKSELSNYPKKLSRALIKKYSPQAELHDFEKCIIRGELPMAAAELFLYSQAVTQIECAKSGVYFAGQKWIFRQLHNINRKKYAEVQNMWNRLASCQFTRPLKMNTRGSAH